MVFLCLLFCKGIPTHLTRTPCLPPPTHTGALTGAVQACVGLQSMGSSQQGITPKAHAAHGISTSLPPNIAPPTHTHTQVPLPELFKPVWDFKARDPADKGSSLLVRGAVAAVLAGCCWALLVAGPDAKAVKDSMENAQDSVLRYFVSIPCPFLLNLLTLSAVLGCFECILPYIQGMGRGAVAAVLAGCCWWRGLMQKQSMTAWRMHRTPCCATL